MKLIREISEYIRAWKSEKGESRAVILIAIDETQAPICNALIVVDGHQRQLTDALKIAFPRNGHLLAQISLAAIEELQSGDVPTDIHFN